MDIIKIKTWSFSQISTYRTCPRQFEERYIKKSIKFQPTVHTKWGIDVHAGLEKRVRDKKPLPDNMKQYEKEALAVEGLPGETKVEYELAFREDWTPTGWWSADAFIRGKLDVFNRNENKAVIADWKTGSFKAPPKFGELDFFSLLTFKKHPEVEKIKTIYRWLKNDAPATVDIINKSREAALEDGFMSEIDDIKSAIHFDRFPGKRSGLCSAWCDVISCHHNGKYKG